MIDDLFERMDSANAGVNEIKNDLSTISQLIESYSISIKELENQMCQLSTTFN